MEKAIQRALEGGWNGKPAMKREKELRNNAGGITCQCGNPISIERINDYWLTIMKSEINKVLEGVEKMKTYYGNPLENEMIYKEDIIKILKQ